MLRSLQLRWWSWQIEHTHDEIPSTIHVYVVLHDPQQSPSVPHSLGLQKALVGVVYGFAQRCSHKNNNIVIAHELLHTVGATDKYDRSTNLPLYPSGYAEPQNSPRYPQKNAELMGGRFPISADQTKMPNSLKQVQIGLATAAETSWRK